MHKTKNPYVKLLEAMRVQGAKDNPGSWGLGTVISAAPLRVEFMGITLEPDQLVRMNRAVYEPGDKLVLNPNQGYDKYLIVGKQEVGE